MESQISTFWRSGSLEDLKRRLRRLTSFKKAGTKRIGAGHFAVVDAHTLETGETVAIKTLKSTASGLSVLQFYNEKRILQGLSHEHIVKVVDAALPRITRKLSQVPDDILIMEHIRGGSLRDLLGKQMQSGTGRLYSNADVCRWCAQIAGVLSHLHSSSPKIIYRDLSAANVLLTSSDAGTANIKLIDFGLIKVVPDQLPAVQQCMGDITDDEALFPCEVGAVQGPSETAEDTLQAVKYTAATGSYMYMAPEVTKNFVYDERCDVFSLGCLLFDLYTRQLRYMKLFKHAAQPGILSHYALTVAAGWREEIPDDMPADIAGIITDCWAQDMGDRPSAFEVEQRLKACLLNLDEAALAHKLARKSSVWPIARRRGLPKCDSGHMPTHTGGGGSSASDETMTDVEGSRPLPPLPSSMPSRMDLSRHSLTSKSSRASSLSRISLGFCMPGLPQ